MAQPKAEAATAESKQETSREVGTNQTILVGRLVASPDLRYSEGGTAFCRMRIAVNSERRTDFIGSVAFGPTAESLGALNLTKGALVKVQGSLRSSSWNAPDGTGKRYRTEVVAATVKAL